MAIPGDASPIFQSIFGEAWNLLPPVMQKHYAVRPGSNDKVMVEGKMDIERSWLGRRLSLVLRLCGALVPFSCKDVPVAVHFTSPPGTRSFVLDRIFHFTGHAPCRYRSGMEQIQGNEVVEFMRSGIGWRLRYGWDGQRVQLHHAGYVWRIFGVLIPLPLEWLIGKGSAWEEPMDDRTFRMWMGVIHPLWGQTYSYSGTFHVTEVCNG